MRPQAAVATAGLAVEQVAARPAVAVAMVPLAMPRIPTAAMAATAAIRADAVGRVRAARLARA